MTSDRATVLYDRDCGFCRWTLAELLRWDRARRLRPLPIQSAEGQRLLEPVPEEDRLASWHLVTADGEVRSAERGFPGLFSRLPAGAPIALVTGAAPGVFGAGYRALVANRTRLGRRIGQERRDWATRMLDERERTIRVA
ncbi:MAG TPA: DCC1-like thiol-disulfide oxidoreductase family protein [Thermoleophilaceae bacterium]|jgi:predicted DCC family thiol-disulfide oxidoreductase YuxK